MGWGPPRTAGRPWRRTRTRILHRDGGICYVCHKPGADQVDHLRPVHLGGTDDDTNLAAIHSRPCHLKKSQREAQAARHKHTARRPVEQHPGLK